MNKLIFVAGALSLASACMSLDSLVAPGDHLDAYDLPTDVIPADLQEIVSFKSSDGATLYGMWAHQETPKPPLIWIHGNGGSFQADFERVEFYWGWQDYDVFALDYRGYGMSDEPATRDGILEEDGLAAVQYVSDTTGVAPEDIPWVALSLGAAVAAHTSDEIPSRGIVLESMFASTDRLLDEGSGLDLPTGWFFTDEWNNVEAVSHSISPVFVIHGLADDFVDPKFGREVYAAAPDPKQLWQPPGVNHSDSIDVVPDEYTQRVKAFYADPDGDPSTP